MYLIAEHVVLARTQTLAMLPELHTLREVSMNPVLRIKKMRLNEI